MNVYIRYYQNQFGNLSTEIFTLKNSQILVAELKDAIQEKFHVDPSSQRLSFKVGDEFLVMLTDDWPLSYFHIKENSHIYLEIIQESNKQEEIQKKILSAAKSKYLKSLGFFNHVQSNLGVIAESNNEYLNDESTKRSQVQTQSLIQNEHSDAFLNAVKNNNLNQVKELFEHYEELDVNMLSKNNGWAALHIAAFNGLAEMVVELLDHKANPNLLNSEGWTALHLAAHKGYDEVIKVLINAPEIDVNKIIPSIGTPLHLACKRNYLKIVSLLLFKADIEIDDSDGKKAYELCTDKNIIKLIQRHKKKKDNKPGVVDLSSFPFLKNLQFIPPKPPRTIGFAEKMGMMIFTFNLRLLELDPLSGTLKRFKDLQDYPHLPHEVIPLKDISICKKIDSFMYSKSYSYFELIYDQRQVFRLHKESSALAWIETLNAAIIYSKFFSKIIPDHPELIQYFSKIKEDPVMIEFNAEEDEKYRKMKLSSKHQPNLVKKDSNNKTNQANKNQSTPSSVVNKKKERRKNPYTQNEEEEVDLAEDSTKLHGITFESFEVISTLGSGTFGKVFKVKLKHTGEIFAMKVINKKYLIKNQQLRYAVTECNVLKQLNNPFIIKLHYAFQTPEHLYMILDYCPGGDLSFHIVRNLFEEEEALFFIAELILAIEHLHSHDIIYRDLKPENILIDADGHIKLADFGLAKEGVGNDRIAQSFCGSPAYLSPEMVNRRGAGKAADIYGVGAVLYEMISGTPPFYANDLGTMYRNIAKSKLMIHDYFSDELKSLLKQLLNRDPKVRIGVNDKSEIKNHEFFANLDWDKLAKRKIKPPINLNEYKSEIDSSAFGSSSNKKKDKNEVIFKDKDYGADNTDYNRVRNFTFVRNDS